MLPELSRRVRRVRNVRRVAVPLYQAYRRATAPRNGNRMLVNSMAKAGTHLLSSQLTRLPEVTFSGIGAIQEHHATSVGLGGAMPAYDAAALQRQLASCPRASFVMSHLFWDEATEAMVDELGFHMVQVVRDPRDVLVSLLHYIRGFPGHPSYSVIAQQFNTWDEQMVAAIEGFPPSIYGRGWAPFSARIENFQPWLSRVPTLRYESFVSADPSVRRMEQVRLLDGLGLPIDNKTLELMSAGIGDKWSATYRQGGAGGWQSEFSDHAYVRFLAVAGDATRALGYDV